MHAVPPPAPFPWIDIVVILLLIVVNALFAMSELAIVSSRRARLRAMAKQGRRGAQTALDLAADPGRFLSTVQTGITLIAIVSGAYSGASLGGPVAERLASEPGDDESAGEGPGPYALQAAIAACHARARRAEDTDWPRIAALYEVLAIRQPSPVVELNRAVALSMAFGPAVGLEIVDQLMEEPALKQYPWLPSVRADLLARLGRNAEAKEEFERAAAMTANARERELLLRRAREQGH